MANLNEFNNTIAAVDALGNDATGDLLDGGEIYLGYIGDSFSAPPDRDVDLIRVQLEEGDVFSARTILFSQSGAILGDTLLRMFDQFGLQVDFDDDLGGALQSALSFTAPADGTYYIGVSGYNNVNYDPTISGSGTSGRYNFAYELALSVRDFNPLEYIASHSDLREAFGTNATLGRQHFESRGAFEGRDVNFDALQYNASYVDLIRFVGVDRDAGARHYIEVGADEGRTPTFDAVQYLANYADLQQAFGGNLEAATAHYILHGFAEGRTDDAIFLG